MEPGVQGCGMIFWFKSWLPRIGSSDAPEKHKAGWKKKSPNLMPGRYEVRK